MALERIVKLSEQRTNFMHCEAEMSLSLRRLDLPPARGSAAPVYDWFTEGFDTKDLQEAKALLDELE